MKNKTKILLITITLLIIASFILAGCGPEELEYETVQEYADSMTENMLIGQNQLDYDKYSKDFTDDMLSAVTEQNFEGQINLLTEAKFSPYVEDSKQFLSAVPNDGYISVFYKIEISENRVVDGEDKKVKTSRRLEMVFQEVGREMKIAGYWYE